MAKLLSMVLKIIERGLNFFIVRIVPIIYHGAIFTLKAMSYSLAAFWTGWSVASERIAWAWMSAIVMMGIPSSLDKYMFPLAKTGAYFLLIYGWTFWAFLTAWLFNSLARFFWGRWINF